MGPLGVSESLAEKAHGVDPEPLAWHDLCARGDTCVVGGSEGLALQA